MFLFSFLVFISTSPRSLTSVLSIGQSLQTYHSVFHKLRQHDHGATFPVVNHLPHVPDGGLHWTLSYDVGLAVLVALKKDVVEEFDECPGIVSCLNLV